MANNGHNEAPIDTKQCPFLNKECIGNKCALYSEMKRMAGGLLQHFGLCAFQATVIILSELSQKATPQQKIQIPTLYKG